MKVHVYDISTSEKMAYIRGVRYIKKNDKYDVVPVTISIRKEELSAKVRTVRFPLVLDISLVKGKGAVINASV